MTSKVFIRVSHSTHFGLGVQDDEGVDYHLICVRVSGKFKYQPKTERERKPPLRDSPDSKISHRMIGATYHDARREGCMTSAELAGLR